MYGFITHTWNPIKVDYSEQVNIGKNTSQNINLPKPTDKEITRLTIRLEQFCLVIIKTM